MNRSATKRTISPASTEENGDRWRFSISVKRGLLIVVATGLIVRIVYLLLFLNSACFAWLRADQDLYWNWGVQISEGQWLGTGVFTQTPLYPYMLGCLISVTGTSQLPVLCLQLSAGLVTCAVIYLCGLKIFDPTTAFAAGMISAVYGPFVFYECMILKTFLSPLLTTLTIWTALALRERCLPFRLFLCGLCIGLACLERENHILMLLPVTAWTVWLSGRQPDFSRIRTVRNVCLLAIGCATAIFPVTVRNYYVSGELIAVTSGGGEVFYLAHSPWSKGYYHPPPFIRPLPSLEHEDFRREGSRRAGRSLSARESSQFWFREGLRYILENPARTVSLTLAKSLILLNDFEVPDSEYYRVNERWIPFLSWLPSFGMLCGFGVLGVIISIRQSSAARLVFGVLLCHAFSVVLLFTFARFRLGMMPAWILFSAYGLVWLLRKLRSPGGLHQLSVASAILLLTVLTVQASLPPYGFSTTDYLQKENVLVDELKQRVVDLDAIAGLRVRAESEHGTVITERLNLARRLEKQRMYDEAERVFREIVEDSPDAGDVKREWARLKLDRSDFKAAEELFCRSFAPSVNDAEVFRNLAIVYHNVGRLDRASQWYRRSVELEPEHVETLDRLAVALIGLQRLDEAMPHLLEVIRLRPENSEAHFDLGRVLYARGQYVEAKERLIRTIELKADHAPAKQLLADTEAAIAAGIGMKQNQNLGDWPDL